MINGWLWQGAMDWRSPIFCDLEFRSLMSKKQSVTCKSPIFCDLESRCLMSKNQSVTCLYHSDCGLCLTVTLRQLSRLIQRASSPTVSQPGASGMVTKRITCLVNHWIEAVGIEPTTSLTETEHSADSAKQSDELWRKSHPEALQR